MRFFSQVGIRFDLLSVEDAVATPDDWVVRDAEIMVDGNGKTNKVVSVQARRLFADNRSDDAVDVILVGSVEDSDVVGFQCEFGVVLGTRGKKFALAHELGHVLSLRDCYDRIKIGTKVKMVFDGECDLVPGNFDGGGQDWGRESQRGFYGLENDLSDVLGSLLMYGLDGADGVDIPMFRITGLPKGARNVWGTDKIKVGAHYMKFTGVKGLMKEGK